MKQYIKLFEDFRTDVNSKPLNERTEEETPAEDVKSKYGAYVHFLTKTLDSAKDLANVLEMSVGQFKATFAASGFQTTVIKALVTALKPEAKVVSEKESTTGWTNELTGERRSGSAASIVFEIDGKKVKYVGEYVSDDEIEGGYVKKYKENILELPILKDLGVSKAEAKKLIEENFDDAKVALSSEIKKAEEKVNKGEEDWKDTAHELAKGIGLDWLASKIK